MIERPADTGFYFDEEHHQFWLNGVPLPSITRILRDTGISVFAQIAEAVRRKNDQRAVAIRRAGLRGDAVHKALHLIAAGTFDWTYFDRAPEYAGWIKSGLEWLRLAGADTLASERPVYHRELHYAGIPDRILRFEGQLCIPDWKTGSAHDIANPIQTALQAMAVESHVHEPHLRLNIYLREDGKPARAEWHNNELRDRQIAAAAVGIWHYSHPQGSVRDHGE